jgi:hypothetical protein
VFELEGFILIMDSAPILWARYSTTWYSLPALAHPDRSVAERFSTNDFP